MLDDLGARPWYGDWPDQVPKAIEIPPIGLGELLRETARRHGPQKALVFLDSIITYAQLDRYVDRLATSLAKLGLGKGDVAALMLPNCHQFVIAFYACQRLGVITTAVNPMYKTLEVKHQLSDSGAKAFIVLDSVYPAVAQALEGSRVEHLIGTNIVDLCGFSRMKVFFGKLLRKIPTGAMPAHTISFIDLLQAEPDPPQVVIDPEKDVAVLQYTGGTTGLPKGAMLSQRNLLANALQCKAWLSRGDVGTGFVAVLPLFHIYAMTTAMNFAVAVGGFQLLFPRPPVNYREWGAQVQKWGKGTNLIMPAVAALLSKIQNTKDIEKYDLSALEFCVSGAGPLPEKVQMEFEKKIGCPVLEGYGLTEASPVTHCNIVDGVRRLGSIGLPFPNTDAKIMDLETGKKQMGLGPDEAGELCVKGPQVMMGYHNQPGETAHALRDGWLYTGDVAYMDERGWTFIKDRTKDLIKYKGFSVFPTEVENYLYAHPDILEAAVVGLPHPESGEMVKAFVVLKPESQENKKISPQDIIEWCRQHMTKFKAPKEVEFLEELPKNTVGKVLRRELREKELAKLNSPQNP